LHVFASGGCAGRRFNNLVNAVVIEVNQHGTGRNENSEAVAEYCCLRVIDFETFPAVELNRENLKWTAIQQCRKHCVEVFCCHHWAPRQLKVMDSSLPARRGLNK